MTRAHMEVFRNVPLAADYPLLDLVWTMAIFFGWRDNAVSIVIRSNFKSDLKLGNKMMIYDCMDAGRVKAFFGQTIKEVTSDEVVLMSARERDPKTAKESARIKNDYVFALIGGEKPTKFLENIGIKIG